MKGLHGLLPPRVRSQDEQVENGLKNSKFNYITYNLCHLSRYLVALGVDLSFVSVIIYSQTLRRCFEQVPVHDRSIGSERKIVLQNIIRKFGRVDANSVYTNCRSSMPKIRIRLQKTPGNLPLQYYALFHTKLIYRKYVWR